MKGNGTRISAVICIIMACILLSGPVCAEQTIVVAVNANWPPMQMKDTAGNITGYEIDMIHAVAVEAGFQVRLVDVPWRSMFRELNEGAYDAVMASVSITTGKKARYDFSRPYFFTEQILVIRRAQAKEPITGKAIGIFKLTKQADMIRKTWGCNMTYYTVEQIDQAFKHLARGELAGVLCDAPVAMNYTSSQPHYQGMFTIHDVNPGCMDQSTEEYGIAVKKGDSRTLDLINKGLEAVKAKGIEDRLKEKWFKDNLPGTMVGYVK
ncbi:MAG: transporter substrate-binding domain-containing protein [Desulfomonilia bacterium]